MLIRINSTDPGQGGRNHLRKCCRKFRQIYTMAKRFLSPFFPYYFLKVRPRSFLTGHLHPSIVRSDDRSVSQTFEMRGRFWRLSSILSPLIFFTHCNYNSNMLQSIRLKPVISPNILEKMSWPRWFKWYHGQWTVYCVHCWVYIAKMNSFWGKTPYLPMQDYIELVGVSGVLSLI